VDVEVSFRGPAGVSDFADDRADLDLVPHLVLNGLILEVSDADIDPRRVVLDQKGVAPAVVVREDADVVVLVVRCSITHLHDFAVDRRKQVLPKDLAVPLLDEVVGVLEGPVVAVVGVVALDAVDPCALSEGQVDKRLGEQVGTDRADKHEKSNLGDANESADFHLFHDRLLGSVFAIALGLAAL